VSEGGILTVPVIRGAFIQHNIAKGVRKIARRLLLVVVIVLLAYHFTGYPAILRPRPDRTSSPWLTERPVESLLVFAPHPDDETLGCAGAIARALDQGARVRVVLMTNGDGSHTAAHTSGKGRLLAPARYVSLGCIRQDETLAALALLGLEPDDTFFLGYPDGGMPALWADCWDYTNLFSSRYTRVNTSPYSNSFTPNAPYFGLSVVDDICTIIRTFGPSHILLPHPNDTHPDHWGTFALVTYALQRLAHEQETQTPPEVLAYLIHRGDWPIPRLYSPRQPLDPPNTLLRLLLPDEWAYLPLASGDCAQKRLAILEHRSQAAIMRMYMLSFVRSNELFAVLRSPMAAQLPVRQGRSPAYRDRHWQTAEPAIWDPQDDTLTRLLGSGADLRAVYAAISDSVLYVMAEPRGRLSSSIRYILDISDFGSPRTMGIVSYGPKHTLRTSGNLHPDDVQVRRTASGVEFAIPLSVFHGDGATSQATPGAVFLAVRTMIPGNILVDRTGWTVLRLSEDEPDIFRGIPVLGTGHSGR
jgi:LmbE family N-acetylglucosaminyl deacetylase